MVYNKLDHAALDDPLPDRSSCIAGIAYAVGFMLMCLFVREGQYPPPPANVDGRPGFISSIKTYAAECFTHRLYWWFFLATALFFTSQAGEHVPASSATPSRWG